MAEVPRDYSQLKKRRNELLELSGIYAQELEDRFVDYALEQTDGNISRAAKEFGMHITITRGEPLRFKGWLEADTIHVLDGE